MAAAIVAHYPWHALREISYNDAPKIFILTDSRLTSHQPLLQYQSMKQMILAQNMIDKRGRNPFISDILNICRD